MMSRVQMTAFPASLLLLAAAAAQPLTSAFTYQGELRNSGAPANGPHDLRFRLYDTDLGGSQVGAALCADNVAVTDGRFTVSLDFGAQFAGQQRFLEIDVRADTGLACINAAGFTTLGPRQALTAAPNAAFALTAGAANSATTATTATNATQLNGQAPSFYQNAGNLTAGTIPSARLAGVYSGALTFSNAGNQFTGIHSGDGAGLTSLNAANISAGALADARLSGNVALLNNAQTFSGLKTFSVAPLFSAAGAPFSVASATRVDSLNADLLDGLDAAAFLQSVPMPLTLSGASPTHVISAENTFASQEGAAAVRGVATSAGSRTAYGGYFQGTGPFGWGVGVFGRGGAHGAIFQGYETGVRGIGDFVGGSFAGEQTGVRAVAEQTSGSAIGGHFVSLGVAGTGVFGNSTSETGTTYGGRFVVRSPTGFGGVFEGLVPDRTVELAGPNGAVNTMGYVNREYTAGTPRCAIPVAYGSISAAGAILGGTGNFTVVHTVAGEYDVTIAGQNYSNAAFSVTVSPVTNSPRVTGVADAGAGVRINIWNLAGTLVDNAFQFTVWTANPQ